MSSELRVLIVEDNPYDVRLVVNELTAAGFEPVWEQIDNETAFRDRLRPQVDVILADYNLPQFGAPQALELLHASGLDVPLIVVSGSIGEDLAVQAIQHGAADYLLKDRLGRLGRAVAQAIEQRRLRLAHRRAEVEIAEWRNRYEAAILASGQLLYDWDPYTDEVVYGGDVEGIVGYAVSELAGGLTRWLKLVHPEDLSAFRKHVEHVKASGEPCHHEYRIVRKDGSVIHCESSGHFIRDSADRVQRMVGFVVDITERRRAEQELRDSRQILQMVLNTIPIGVFWKDRKSRYLGCNRMVSQAFGFANHEAIFGKTDHELPGLKKEQADFFVKTDLEIIESGVGRYGIIEPATLADGRTIWMETSKIPMHDAEDRIVGVLGVWQDITERQRLEEQVRQSVKMEAIGRLAGGVAHDFNNLLTIITGYSDLLLKQIDAGGPHRALVDQISRAGAQATRLTRQLLAFSRKGMLVPAVIDLSALLAELEKLLAPLLGEDIDLVIRPAADLWRVKVDPGEMEQVIMNLAVNARDAMPTGGKLTIETVNVRLDVAYAAAHADARAGEHVLLAVSDTGCGMDSATRTRIFEPFFTTKGPEKGTGLGLATVYGIVKQSGGHIEVYSEPGQGSAFKVYLPRERDGAPLSKSAHGIKSVPKGSETVLLSEDEEGVRKLARLVLEQHGYKVLDARDGEEAIAVCKQHGADVRLLITDVIMPNMSGPQLAERLRQIRPGLKVLYLSGYTDDAIVRHGILEGEAPFLQKPFSPDGLAHKVREVLDG